MSKFDTNNIGNNLIKVDGNIILNCKMFLIKTISRNMLLQELLIFVMIQFVTIVKEM